MTTSNAKEQIAKAFAKTIENLKGNYKGSSLTDMFLVVDKDNAELSIYDDEENLLEQRIIDSWMNTDKDNIVRQLRDTIDKLNRDNKFDTLDIYKPFSINLADENFDVLEELLLIEDDSVIFLENDFLERMDKEFDDFLDKLLKD